MVNAMPWSFYPPGKTPGTHCTGDFVGPGTGLNRSGLKKIPYARRGSNPKPHNIALISVYHICKSLGTKLSHYRYPTH
jgi:hypothetical protein